MTSSDLPREGHSQDIGFEKSVAGHHDLESKDSHELEDPDWHLDFKIVMTFIVMMIQYNASFFSLTLTSPIASYINEDLGPKDYYVWIPVVWPLAFAATMTTDGRLGDLFGRRWLMIGGNVLAVVACIIGGTAKSIAVVILAVGLLGIAGAIQQTASASVAELVPRKYRPQATSSVAGSGIVGGSFGIPIAIHVASRLSWRWGFWITLIASAVGAIGLFCFYFPPTFEEVHQRDRRTKWQELKDFDYIGFILFTGGITVLLLGISWGGVSYPWKSAGVIVPIIIGVLTLVAFGFWEVYGNSPEPVVPYKLFKNVRGFTMVLVAEMICGMMLYALIALYPVQISTMYESNPSIAAWESCTVLLATFAGVLIMGNLIGRIGHAKLIFVISVFLNTVFIGTMAAMKPSMLAGVLTLTTLMGLSIGFVQLIGIVMITLNCPDKDLGVAVGLNGTARTTGGSIATAIYSTILTNKVKDNLPGNVAKAVLPLGFPVTSLKPLILALVSGSPEAVTKVPDITLPVLGAAGDAVKLTYYQGFKLVYLVAIAFGVVATVCAAFTRDIDHLLTNVVAVKLHTSDLQRRFLGDDSNKTHVTEEVAPVHEVEKA